MEKQLKETQIGSLGTKSYLRLWTCFFIVNLNDTAVSIYRCANAGYNCSVYATFRCAGKHLPKYQSRYIKEGLLKMALNDKIISALVMCFYREIPFCDIQEAGWIPSMSSCCWCKMWDSTKTRVKKRNKITPDASTKIGIKGIIQISNKILDSICLKVK